MKRHFFGIGRASVPSSRTGDGIISMLVTVTIFAIIIGILTEMFIVLLRTYYIYDARAGLVRSASDIAKEFASMANLAFGIEPSRTVNSVVYTTGASTAILRLASIDASGNPINGTYDYVVYTKDAAQPAHLLKITDADAASSRIDGTKLLTDALAEHLFAYKDADPATTNDVFFMLTLHKTIGRATAAHILHTYAKLRNK